MRLLALTPWYVSWCRSRAYHGHLKHCRRLWRRCAISATTTHASRLMLDYIRPSIHYDDLPARLTPFLVSATVSLVATCPPHGDIHDSAALRRSPTHRPSAHPSGCLVAASAKPHRGVPAMERRPHRRSRFDLPAGAGAVSVSSLLSMAFLYPCEYAPDRAFGELPSGIFLLFPFEGIDVKPFGAGFDALPCLELPFLQVAFLRSLIHAELLLAFLDESGNPFGYSGEKRLLDFGFWFRGCGMLDFLGHVTWPFMPDIPLELLLPSWKGFILRFVRRLLRFPEAFGFHRLFLPALHVRRVVARPVLVLHDVVLLCELMLVLGISQRRIEIRLKVELLRIHTLSLKIVGSPLLIPLKPFLGFWVHAHRLLGCSVWWGP